MDQFGLESYIIPSRFKITNELINTYTKSIDWDIVNIKKCKLIKQSSDWLESKINNKKPAARNVLEKGSQVITDVTKLGLSYPVTIETIVTKLPRNTTIVLSIDKKENTVTNVPESCGILSVKKTSDHYVCIHYVKAVEQKEPIKIFVGKWLDGLVGGWVRVLTTDDLDRIQGRLALLENKIK